MDLEIVTVGTELLLGVTSDTNASEIAGALTQVGARVVRRVTVPDDRAAISEAVEQALDRTGVAIVTGGLGPTPDDLTRESVAGIFSLPLELDSGLLAALEERFAELGRGPMPVSNRSQAEVPKGATVLPNPTGTAPGLWIEQGNRLVILLPGVPSEMRALLDRQVLPRIRTRMAADGEDGAVVASRTLRTTGIAESALADRLADATTQLGAVQLAFLPTLRGVDLRLTVVEAPEPATAALDRAEAVLAPRLSRHWYGCGEEDLAVIVVDRLRSEGARLAVAESCTGGLIGVRVTENAGASDVFAGGVICYGDRAKISELGVPAEVIEREGAVSEAVVRAMIQGSAERFGVEAVVAVTGIAGPGGERPGKPVGTVWLGARFRGSERAVKRWFPGGRHDVRERSAQAGLDLLRRLIDEPDGEVRTPIR